MKRGQTWLRLVTLGLLIGLLMVATAAPATPAEPLGATVGITAPAAWAGHPACGAMAHVTLSGDSLDVGGYETRLSFNTAYLGYSSGRISQSDFLTDGGTRRTGGDDGAVALEAAGAGSVKFGDYSWGTNSGADANGSPLATVRLDVVKCGASNLSLSETQVVNYKGDLLSLTSQAVNVPLTVHGLYDTNGSGGNITAADVATVLNAVGTSSACDANYYLDTNQSGGNITAADVATVLNSVGTPSCP